LSKNDLGGQVGRVDDGLVRGPDPFVVADQAPLAGDPHQVQVRGRLDALTDDLGLTEQSLASRGTL